MFGEYRKYLASQDNKRNGGKGDDSLMMKCGSLQFIREIASCCNMDVYFLSYKVEMKNIALRVQTDGKETASMLNLNMPFLSKLVQG